MAELAEALGVSVQQVSRDETNAYHGVSAEKAQRVLEVLGVRFHAEVEEPLVTRDPEAVPAWGNSANIPSFKRRRAGPGRR